MDNFPNFDSYRAEALAKGYDEVLERHWAPDKVTSTHSHPFAVAAVLVQGEMWLEQGPITVHLVPGTGFELKANVPHSERYGPECAMLFAARRQVKDGAT